MAITAGLPRDAAAAGADVPQGEAPEQEEVMSGYDPAKSQKALEQQRASVNARRKDLLNLAESRKNMMFNPELLAIAQGLLAPTATGGFGESLGKAAGNLQQAQSVESQRQVELAKMRMELEQGALQQQKEESEYSRQNTIRDLSGKLVNFSTDDKTGAFTYKVDPTVAKQLTQLTGDTKYADRVIADTQMKAEQKLAGQMFQETTIPGADGQPGRTVYKFNPQAVMNMAKISANPVEMISKYSKMIPDLRKSGMIEGLSDNGSPFDAIAAMAPANMPAVKAQAERLAKQYKEGRLDEDKANTLSQQMLTMMTSSMDRQSAQDLQKSIIGLNVGMRQQSLALQREGLELRKDERDRKRELDSNKLTDEQKIAYNKIVAPAIKQGEQALAAMNEVDSIRTTVASSPSGMLEGFFASTIGSAVGSDKNTAQRALDSWSKRMITQIPRLPGSASNLDAANLEKSLGKLSDLRLTNEQRNTLLDEIYGAFERLNNRAFEIQNYWDANKKVMPIDGKAPAASSTTAPAASGSAPRKFTVIREQ
jgi:hypothetical protein